jgi:hypothetical protein
MIDHEESGRELIKLNYAKLYLRSELGDDNQIQEGYI